MQQESGVGAERENERLSGVRFLTGLFIMFVAFYSQYLLEGLGQVPGMLLVYGVPFVAVSLIYGKTILKTAFSHTGPAFKLGISAFSMFELLGSLVGVVIYYLLVYFSPESQNQDRQSPLFDAPSRFGWLMMWVSMIVIGPAEEYLFRGFVYGGLLSLYHKQHWLGLALLSSLFFAIAHIYYAFAYGLASLVVFCDLMAFGMAMCFTYYFSGGNLIVPALLHGLYDAGGFLTVAVSPSAGTIFRGLMIVAGVMVAVILAGRSLRQAIST
jgi:membrane protease YdiL (CAAX protease family)